MDTLRSFPVITLSTLLFFYTGTASGTTFTFANKCGDTIWPGILSNAGSPELGSTGFELTSGSTRSFQAPTGWSGRFWARTGCAFGAPGGTCTTGDCGSGTAECGGAGATPPATLAEFTLAGPTSDKDFYDVSLVDGYNLPLLVDAGGGCQATGCAADLNRGCPAELKTSGGCRSACEAFGTPEFCCAGEFSTPATCRPSVYSEMFKTACPKSYSYAYDDATSTFTCSGADYTITFCPDSSPSQKSSRDNSNTPSAPKTATGGVMLEDDSWLASLATGSANAAGKSAYPSLLMHLLAAGYMAYVLLLL